MDGHTATETAFRNGYAEGFADARKALLPCKIGDKVYAIRNYSGQRLIRHGRVSQMYYNSNMNLVIVMHQIIRGLWGETIFGTEKDARAVLQKEREGK